MSPQRTANLVKGFAWLSLAAAAMPAFTTLEGPTGAATRLTVGLPWSPWLVYRETWVNPATPTTPALSCEATVEPRSDSMFALFAGVTLLLVSRFLRSHGSSGRGSRIQGSAFTFQTAVRR